MMNRNSRRFRYTGKTTLKLGIVLAGILFGDVFLSNAQAGNEKYNCPDLAEKATFTKIGQAEYQGQDGWFYRSSDLNHLYTLTSENIVMLRKLNNLLGLKGTKLALVPVPPRAVMSKEFLSPEGFFGDLIYDESFAENEFRKLVGSAQNAGLAVADVLGYLDRHSELDKSRFYFSRNLHWTPQGALWTAQAVSELIKSLVQFDESDHKKFVSSNTGTNRILDSEINLALNEVCKDQVPHETIDIYDTKDESQSLDAFLTDDAQNSVPVVLIGTSFSDDSRPYHFSGFLRSELQSEVENRAISGGGMDEALFDWAHSSSRQKKFPKVLIWELPFIDRLPSFPEQSARQILPAIGGLCAQDENSVQDQAYSKQNQVVMTLDKPGMSGSNLYLSSDLSDPTIRAPQVTLTYADGKVEDVVLKRPDRIQKADKLFWELSDQYGADLKTVEIKFDPNKPESGTLSLCKYPVAVAGATTN